MSFFEAPVRGRDIAFLAGLQLMGKKSTKYSQMDTMTLTVNLFVFSVIYLTFCLKYFRWIKSVPYIQVIIKRECD
jgi:hypothetical protein